MKPLKILFFSYDWEDKFLDRLSDIKDKLERDHLNPNLNHFFYFSWSNKSYYKKISKNIETFHAEARFLYVRPIYDLLTIIFAPIVTNRYSFKPDVVIINDFSLILGTLYFKLVIRSKIILFVTNLPASLAKTRKHRNLASFYYTIMEKLGRRFVDYAFVINDTTKEYALRRGIEFNKIHVITPNTIARDKLYIEKSQAGVIRKRYDIGSQKRIILSVGRLEAEKGFSDLLKTFLNLDDSYILIIVGEGSLKEYLKNQAKGLGIFNRVIFAGKVGRDEIWNYYKDADVFMLFSRSEGLGLVFWEAMYSKVPVIGPCTEGIAESIGSNGLRGFFWNEGDDIEVLRHNIDVCCKKTKETEEMLVRAREYVIKKIDSQSVINDLI